MESPTATQTSGDTATQTHAWAIGDRVLFPHNVATRNLRLDPAMRRRVWVYEYTTEKRPGTIAAVAHPGALQGWPHLWIIRPDDRTITPPQHPSENLEPSK